MNRTHIVHPVRRLLTLLAGLALAFTFALPAQPAAASGAIQGVAPTALTFATQQLLSTGTSQGIRLTLSPFTPYVGIRVDGDFIQENSCMRPIDTFSGGVHVRLCGVKVTFKPTTTGVRTGTIYAGTQAIAKLSGTGADLPRAVKTVQENSQVAQEMKQTSPATAAAWTNFTNMGNSGVGSALAAALQAEHDHSEAEKAELEAQANLLKATVQEMQDTMNQVGIIITEVQHQLQTMMQLNDQVNRQILNNL